MSKLFSLSGIFWNITHLILENLHFAFNIKPAMCTLWEDKATSTELIAWIEKPLKYSFSRRQHSDPPLRVHQDQQKLLSKL